LLINLVKSLKMLTTLTAVNGKHPQQIKGEKNRLMNDSSTRLLIEEFQELRESPLKKCEWCHQPLPNERYHLRICPKCRKATIDAFLKGEL
jgi:Zn finger protein HypA/HybF involved in hydrogenase expression